MNNEQGLVNERLVRIHRSENRLGAELLAGFLRDNGVEAVVDPRTRTEMANLGGYGDPDSTCRVYVMEHEASRARLLVDEFLTASLNEQALEELALQKPQLNEEKIGEQRAALQEERRTLQFIGCLVVAVVAAVLLGRWVEDARLVVIVIAALLVGCWMGGKQ